MKCSTALATVGGHKISMVYLLADENVFSSLVELEIQTETDPIAIM